jgi:hypothetical protein
MEVKNNMQIDLSGDDESGSDHEDDIGSDGDVRPNLGEQVD